MHTQLIRGLAGLSFLAFGSLLLGQNPTTQAPTPGPNLAEYRSPAQAIRAKVNSGVARPGQTGYLGVSLLRDEKGRLIVQEVQPDSPAAQAGIKKGDLVQRIGDQPVRTPEVFREWLQTRTAGETVKIGLLREGKEQEVAAKLVATSKPMSAGGSGSTPRAYLGITSGDFKEGQGLRVEQVSSGSPAEAAGLKSGDRIAKIDGKDLLRSTGLADTISEKRPGDALALVVNRDGKEVAMKATLGNDRGRVSETGALPLVRKDVFKLGVVLLEFADVKHHEKSTVAEWERSLFSKGTHTDKNASGQAVHGSLNDYFQEQSGGKFRLEGKVFDWVQVGKKRSDYVQGSGTSNKTAPLTEGLDKLLARDGKEALKGFDGLVFVYAGERVQINRGAVYYPHAGSLLHQNRRWVYLLGPEGGARMTSISTFAKEMGLALGLPDLAARTENVGSEGLGVWCALSSPLGNGRPQHFSAWAKERIGWLQPTPIDPTVKQKLILAPIEDAPHECFKVLVRPDGSEYYLLENRKKKGFDSDLPAEGLLIWHVANDRPLLIESHGVEGPTGPTVHLESVPYPSKANTALTPDTTPSSRSPLGGGLPVHITEIRRLPDGRITFHIGYEYR